MGITPTHSSVGDAASSTTILAENAARRGATITNASTALLYLLLNGQTANTLTAHDIRLAQGASYDLPRFDTNGKTECYTGAITGIWASDAGGSANVVEWT